MMVSSCSDDNDLPNVDITMSFDNAVVDDGTVYVVQDSVFSITSITTKSVDSGKSSAIANIKYFWNGRPAPGLTWSGMPVNIDMAIMPQPASGNNVLALDATLLEVDKSISYCTLRIPVKAVKIEDMPNGVEPGEATLTFTSSRSGK